MTSSAVWLVGPPKASASPPRQGFLSPSPSRTNSPLWLSALPRLLHTVCSLSGTPLLLQLPFLRVPSSYNAPHLVRHRPPPPLSPLPLPLPLLLLGLLLSSSSFSVFFAATASSSSSVASSASSAAAAADDDDDDAGSFLFPNELLLPPLLLLLLLSRFLFFLFRRSSLFLCFLFTIPRPAPSAVELTLPTAEAAAW